MRLTGPFVFVKVLITILTFSCLISETTAENSYDGKNRLRVKDGLGRYVNISTLPRRIISTIPSNTEILYDLGLKNKVIAVTSHCVKTCDVSGKAIIGGWSQPEIVEKIVDLNPDLVVAFGGLQKGLAYEMDERKITTFVFFPQTIDQALEQILVLGKITETGARAKDIVRRCRNNLLRIQGAFKDIPPQERPRCLRLISTEGIVVGGTSFQNDIIRKAGGINIFEDMRQAYPVVTLKDVRDKDPDMIILNRDDEKKAIQWFLKQDGWRDLRAAREGKVIAISCDYICHPNTRLDKTVEILASRLYPDRFPLDSK